MDLIKTVCDLCQSCTGKLQAIWSKGRAFFKGLLWRCKMRVVGWIAVQKAAFKAKAKARAGTPKKKAWKSLLKILYRIRWALIAAAAAAGIAAAVLTGAAADVAEAVFGPPAVVISIDDPNLEDALRRQLAIWGRPVMEEDAHGVKQLRLEGKGIRDIRALAIFSDLTHLDLSGNMITDIGALSGLATLEKLELANNRIRDISALANLKQLTEVSLAGNRIDDISALSGLAALKTLYLDHNMIADPAPLGGLAALEKLALENNRISSIAPLAGCARLRELTLKYNPLVSLDGAAGLKELEYINIEKTLVGDVSGLAGRVWIDAGKLPPVRLSLDLGEYFLLKNLTLPIDVGDAHISWTSSDQDAVTVSAGKVQATNVHVNVLDDFYRHSIIEGRVDNSDIVFILETTVSHGSYYIEIEDTKTKYKTGNYILTGNCSMIDPKAENVIGVDIEYDITVTKGRLGKFAVRAYINDARWKNYGEINAAAGGSGILHIDFEEPVSISKYWIIPTERKSGQWTDFSCICSIYFANREIFPEDAHQLTGRLPEAI